MSVYSTKTADSPFLLGEIIQYTLRVSALSCGLAVVIFGVQRSFVRVSLLSVQFFLLWSSRMTAYERGEGSGSTLSTCSHTSPEQASNVFVERALTYVLGYLLWTEGTEAAESNTMKADLRHACEGDRALAIKLRADNDFYSQTSQARRLRYLPRHVMALPFHDHAGLSTDDDANVHPLGMSSASIVASTLKLK